MIAQIPGLQSVSNMFMGRSSGKKASLALARILTQLDMEMLPYLQGYQATRRRDTPRQVAVGIWLIPIPAGVSDDAIDMSRPVAAVTCDLRREGIGCLVWRRMKAPAFVVAVSDKEAAWKFFRTQVRHVTTRPGCWFQIGLHVDGLLEPEQDQLREFFEAVNDQSDCLASSERN